MLQVRTIYGPGIFHRRGGSPRSLDVKWTAHSSIATPLPQQMQML